MYLKRPDKLFILQEMPYELPPEREIKLLHHPNIYQT